MSAFVYESVDVTIFNNPLSAVAPVATDEDRSGSKSTSAKETDAVEKELADAVVPTNCSSVSTSLIEYPNLPAPYKPPLASTFEPDVLPYTSAFSVWLPVCAVPYLKSR